MSLPCSTLTTRLVFSVLGTIAVFLTYRLSTNHAGVANIVKMPDRSTSDPIDNLEVSLKQTGWSRPVLQATVINKNSYPVTVLSYDSPLDSLALKLGLLSITPEGNNKPLELVKIQVRRLWPPPADALIPIAPGEIAVNNITFGGEDFDQDVLKSVSKASVVLAGNWQAVWAKAKSSVEEINLGGIEPDPDVHQGSFSSKPTDIIIG